MNRHLMRKGIQRFILYVLILLFVLVSLLPFYWITISSVTDQHELFSIPPKYFPQPTLENFVNLISQLPFQEYLRNSLVFATGSTVLAVFLSFLAAYGFARYPVPGSGLLLLGLVLSMALPEITTVVPLFRILRDLKLINTVRGLIVVMSSVLIPFTVWTLVSFVQRVPSEMEEAAIVDGTNLLQRLWYIVLPVMKPSIATMLAINFINAWNNLIYPLVFTSTPQAKTLSVAVTEVFQARTPYGRPWELISALGVTMVIPAVIIVLVSQKAIVSGLTRGAIK
ncbi:carbohydrate ABC transporter permease [Candidatus Darwinibacter acetoxidans]